MKRFNERGPGLAGVANVEGKLTTIPMAGVQKNSSLPTGAEKGVALGKHTIQAELAVMDFLTVKSCAGTVIVAPSNHADDLYSFLFEYSTPTETRG